MSQEKIFWFFSLHTYVLPFTIIECQLGDILLEAGCRPVLTRPLACTCRVNHHFGKFADSYVVKCPNCEANDAFIRTSTPGWEHTILSKYAEPQDGEYVDGLLVGFAPSRLREFQIEGIEVGKIALHDVLLSYKRADLAFDEGSAIWADILNLVRGCLLVGMWLRRALRTENIVGLCVYNSHYSINRMACAICKQEGVPTYSIHGGASLRYLWETLMLVPGDIDQYKPACRVNWSRSYKNRALRLADVKLVGEHFDELTSGTMAHAYSAPVGSADSNALIKTVNPDGKRKVLLAATSSADERFALEQSGIREIFPDSSYMFPTQIEWLEFLVSKVGASDDVALIIRVHPRELPNKRESQESSNAVKLRELLQALPDNVIVNWPTDNISLYELILRVDLVLTCWSSAGLEASLFGCPIVLPRNPVQLYQLAADTVCESEDSYWKAIQEQCHRPWAIERSIRTFRWYWLVQFGGTVSLVGKKPRRPRLLEYVPTVCQSVARVLQRFGLPAPEMIQKRFANIYFDHMRLARRPTELRGRSVIAQTLLGSFNPLLDFREMQKLQDDAHAAQKTTTTANDERVAVADEVRRICQVIAGQSDLAGLKVEHLLSENSLR
jgi:hypothetical protein